MRGKWLLVSALLLGLMLGAVVGLSTAQDAESEVGPSTSLGTGAAPQAMVGTGFTYQGRLNKGGSPHTGICNFKFSLHNALSGGYQFGATQTIGGVDVQDGLFTVVVNAGNEFADGAFTGQGRWLAIEVQCTGDGSYTPLEPRQTLTAAPYALALPGLWTEQNATSPNVIGGHGGNSVADGVVGATISGGGEEDFMNGVTGSWATIGGGRHNWAGYYATVGGGDNNTASGDRAAVGGGIGNTASGDFATVGGGWDNTASGYDATVGGGASNTASGDNATVGGGVSNVVSGSVATVCGGYCNTASGELSTVCGGYYNAVSGDNATVGGGEFNVVTGTARFGTIPGGFGNYVAGHDSFAAGTHARAKHDGTFVWADCGANCAEPWYVTPFASTMSNQFMVRANGGVKMVKGGSTFSTSAAGLQVENQTTYGEAAWLYTSDAANNVPVLKLIKHPDSLANFLEGKTWEGGGTSAVRKFHIDKDGTYHAGSDFAEALPTMGHKDDYEPGDVLVISSAQPGAVERCTQPYDGAVIGVYSTRPGFLGADKDGATQVWPGDIPVAVMGIVPVKVSAENGPIRPGDLLTTSATPGHAMRCEGVELCFGRTLGKALEGLDSDTGVIKMLVMLQ